MSEEKPPLDGEQPPKEQEQNNVGDTYDYLPQGIFFNLYLFFFM
jgi:hypothetical protein